MEYVYSSGRFFTAPYAVLGQTIMIEFSTTALFFLLPIGDSP